MGTKRQWEPGKKKQKKETAEETFP